MTEKYEYVKAIIDDESELTWEYKIPKSTVLGRMSYEDECVEEYTDEQIKQLTADMLNCDKDIVEVIYE